MAAGASRRRAHCARAGTIAITSVLLALFGFMPSAAGAASGDPQAMTDDPWYPGELSCSTFERLFATQAALYKRVTGRDVQSDEDKALASWYWRNLHFAHGEEGKQDCFAAGFDKAEWNRDYWTGLFAHGFALCGTTHSQYTAEIEALLGHCRGRCVGVEGHNSFEAFLTGGAYGEGRWVLLDHDLSTVIYSPDGARLLSIPEIVKDLKTLKNPKYKPEKQHGWRVAGLADQDSEVYTTVRTVEYAAGYAGPPPMVQLRPGESLRRYLEPGLEDGKTFVFWGMNYNAVGIPGPARDRTWVNQPQKMYNSKDGTGQKAGQVRFANAVYSYAPRFADGSYRQGVIDESPDHVTFEFYSPYVIGCTPADDSRWGIYRPGGTNGLILHGKGNYPVQISTDQGKSWQDCGVLSDGLDLTDRVKGFYQYQLRFGASPDALKSAGLNWRTACQCNAAIIPRLHDGTNRITFLASGQGLISAGPTKAQAEAHVVEGSIGSRSVTLELAAPRAQRPVHLYAASWQSSGAPPAPVKYQIEWSIDGGRSWRPVVRDWKIQRRAPEPNDFWSQSFCWGDVALPAEAHGPVRVRFANDGGKSYRKVEAHLAYAVAEPSATRVTFAWAGKSGLMQTATHTYGADSSHQDGSWAFPAGEGAQTRWVEFAVK